MRFSHVNQIAALLALSSSLYFASADNSLLEVVDGDDCVDLVTGTDNIVLGSVCTEVTGDNVVVTFNMSAVSEDCCIKETHICNMPPMVANIEEDGCAKTKVVPFSITDVFGFMCSDPCDTFQFNGHATVICDEPLRGDNDRDVEPGDPLPDGAGQGNYGEDIYCYGAMYDVGLVCDPGSPDCTILCPAFTCDAPATICGEAQGANGVFCYCSRDIDNAPPNEELDDFCWQDIGCFVPIVYLTTTPGVPCTSNDVCLAGTRCVPSTCCGESLCLPTCNPAFGDKGLDEWGVPPAEWERAMQCANAEDPAGQCASGCGSQFECLNP